MSERGNESEHPEPTSVSPETCDLKGQSSGSREPGKYSRANWRSRCVETRSASRWRSPDSGAEFTRL